MADEAESRSLALLIDADNTSAHYATEIFDEIASLGEANVRRVYGDFSGSRLSGGTVPVILISMEGKFCWRDIIK